MTAAIRTLHLTKFYGRHRGIDDVDLTVETGEVFGFLGPNGAGKSTTIKLLIDILRPTRGSASVLGLDPRVSSVELRRRIGYLPGDLALYPKMTGRALCHYFSSIHDVDGMIGIKSAMRADQLAERLHLDLDRRIGELSSGNRQKVGLVQAFMHDPELLILDEPTSGIDPLIQQEFYSLVNETRDRGGTVFLSSHVLPEVEHVADRVALIRDGKIVVVERLSVLKEAAVRSIEVHFARPVDANKFGTLKSVVEVAQSSDQSRMILRVAGDIDKVIKAIAKHKVLNLVSEPGDLEDVFLDYYRDDPRLDEPPEEFSKFDEDLDDSASEDLPVEDLSVEDDGGNRLAGDDQ